MTDTAQPKATHPAHKISTAILALLVLLAGGGYALWNHTEHHGYLSVTVGDDPLMQTADIIPDDFGKSVKPAKKKVAASEPVATDYAPPLPAHKPTPPPQVQ